jgi:menaquinone-dependent protoporphyrinogen oxidase
MNKILVAFATMSGSTAEVARAIGEEIAGKGGQVEVLPLEKVGALDAYDAVILGAPMNMGWHRPALEFLRRNSKELERIPLAIFATCMSLYSSGETAVNGVPVFPDPDLARPPQDLRRPGLRERYANVTHYAAPMLKAAGSARPVSIAFFGGRLDYYRLKPLARLFVMLVVQAQPGDRRNWQAIRSWAGSLLPCFSKNKRSNPSFDR